MTSKLEQLKQFCKERFEQASSKEDIETLSSIQNSLEDVEREQSDLENKNAELIKSYKDLVKHTSFKDDKTVVTADPVAANALPSFDEILSQFAEK